MGVAVAVTRSATDRQCQKHLGAMARSPVTTARAALVVVGIVGGGRPRPVTRHGCGSL